MTARQVDGQERRLKRRGALAVVLLLAWSAIPVAWLLWKASQSGGTFTGADGPFAADQLQYLSWVRESASHLFAGNMYDIPPGDRVYLHPMAVVSAGLWRAGVDIAYTLLPWKLPAALAIGFATHAYARRLLPEPGGPTAATMLGLFYVSPLVPLQYAIGPRYAELDVLSVAGEVLVAGTLWGYLPAALSVGLMPAYLLTAERATRDASLRRTAVLAAIGLTVSWLHPWQGVILLIITGALVLWDRFSAESRRLIVPAAITALPVLGYIALARFDSSWAYGQLANQVARPRLILVFFVFVPLATLAALGLRRPDTSLQERALVLWPVAAILAYAILPSFPTHAFQGIAIPLAVLGVRAVFRHGRRWRRALLATCVIVLTLPGALYFVDWYIRFTDAFPQAHVLHADETRALRYLDERRDSGGVLTTADLGAAVPPRTGRPSWIGHPSWTPGFLERARDAEDLAAGRLSQREAEQLLASSGAGFVLLGCDHAGRAEAILDDLARSSERFGCAKVYSLS